MEKIIRDDRGFRLIDPARVVSHKEPCSSCSAKSSGCGHPGRCLFDPVIKQ